MPLTNAERQAAWRRRRAAIVAGRLKPTIARAEKKLATKEKRLAAKKAKTEAYFARLRDEHNARVRDSQRFVEEARRFRIDTEAGWRQWADADLRRRRRELELFIGRQVIDSKVQQNPAISSPRSSACSAPATPANAPQLP
jgi:hypothetical protein